MAFKFQIKARLSGAVLFEAELAAEYESKSLALQMGEATKAAYLRGADLRGAYTPTEYRAHVARQYPNTEKAAETLAIIDFVEMRAVATAAKQEAA